MNVIKKLLIVNMLLFLFLASNLSAATAADAFADIDVHWARQSIEKIQAVELIKGYPDGSYRPDQPVTCLEAITIVLNGAGYASEVSKIKRPKNSPPSAYQVPWGQNYLDFALEKKFIPQLMLNDFTHDRAITREELAELIAKSFYMKGTETPPKFTDSSAFNPEYMDGVIALNHLGVMGGYPDGTFRPKNAVSRAEIASMLGRLYDQGWIHLDSKRKVSGWISNVSQQKNGLEIELTDIYGTVKVLADPSCRSYWQGQAMDLNQTVNYRIEGILNSGRKVAYVELLERRNFSPVQRDMYASFVRIAEGEPVILTVKSLQSDEKDYPIAWDADIIDEKSLGKTTKSKDLLKKLKQGQFLSLGLTSGETIKTVMVLDVKTITGEVSSLDRTLRLKSSGSGNKNKYVPTEFWAWDWGRLVDKSGDEINNIYVGDKVKITYIGAPFEERVLEIQRQ
ncbi:S-layer homology domain-containing protein [Desulforamulus aquiferis]|uniref:S-layer homology domain-containing protein n=1 Tax=Desulforamulus aquiferis TaxID=1397668 RepID=A0AAW7ZGL0_9FIRM|nr:S-layer homology domain-containing protein [Desulforamulus aquiferis]MDO7788454.1 S-layer homology domain-containing protein [Desulforamulus aquiferis]